MKKKIGILGSTLIIFSILLTSILVCTIPRLSYTYSQEYEGYLVYKAYGNSESYTIPEEYKGVPIVGTSDRAFFRHSKLKNIEFKKEENIIFIGRLSFSECPKLKSISLTNVRIIERNAFSYCEALENVSLPKITDIAISAFYGCRSLQKMEFGNELNSIGSLALAECPNLLELRIPKSCCSIGRDAFYNSGFNQVYVPKKFETVEYIKNLSFVVFYE